MTAKSDSILDTAVHTAPEKSHKGCETDRALLRENINDLMSGYVPLYHVNRDRLDG